LRPSFAGSGNCAGSRAGARLPSIPRSKCR